MRLDEDLVAIRDSVRRMVQKHVVPLIPSMEADDRFPSELVPVFGDMGLLQLWLPEQYGGPGGNLKTVCIVKEEIAKVSLAAATLCGNNSISFVLPILHFGTEEQKARWLPLAAEGRLVSAIAVTEPQSGSDVSSIRTRAVRDGDTYVINGQKNWITWGGHAHYVLLFARTSEAGGSDGISAFLVDTRTPGFRLGRKEHKMGRHGAPNHELFFDDMRVPVDCRLGAEGEGFKACMKVLDLNRPTIAATSLGLAQGALDVAVAYAKDRRQFGRPIAEFQGMQFKLADMAIKVEAARNLLYNCADEIDSGDHSRLNMLSSITKCFVTDIAMEVTTEAVQVLGSYGYSKEFPVERMMRDAKLNQIIEGTNEIHRLIVARRLLAD
ncbi:acyl-CoA dehydrogenase family protein [Caballeronia ptereochthonis]|uniref:3-sulfinopropanoyl-CoA desulfinase n=1 Tax=Caballeronia ptereochthonis TaxID=1777144 RepID=A0A158CCI7_9BURK|nr:acyl-CoA dehydrogenase family protein [Caballeronia ptereochthonis]SAK80014.1 Acyl-CoA dehydrogenase [Caballeronia ptereochthonis]